ncbi:MAG: phosphopantetheine adenylyltransferase [Burkholderiales bacterium]|nr:phosphopantetheine adenylyltransferase [Burkholderiales bacterium]
MKYVSIVALLFAGIIHLLPVPGFTGVSTLARLYGIEVNDPNTAILLQHRALLFGVLGVLMLSAIALPWLRVTALTVALFSAASFIVVAMAVGGYNTAIGRVVVADVVASVLLAAGLVAELWLIGRKTT